MSEVERLQARIDDLEIRHAFQEDLIRQLDEVTQVLHDRLDTLAREVETLRAQVAQPTGQANRAEDELPPHY
ncbi:MAG: SlyX family protein [Deltaproteobacteria bacterium]|nr:SlyX family protein [Deltaproteobacteria bacterium]MBK9366476.1 SlyX family protein [Deltaproteobacteria bacterium]MBK9644438.1 SlyX family protein [Deltaproteobacteria bacterium]